MLNIVCTSKPVDGLLYYSYEYCSHLNEEGISAQVYVITHRDFTSGDYTEALSDKYIHCKNIVFNNEYIADDSITMIMGNSMMTLAHMGWRDYTKIQQASLKKLFGNKLISVYSENHPTYYPKAEKFFSPKQIISLCDTDVYPNGVGNHFEKIINFDIYKEPKDEIEFEHLFLGTNREYYETLQEVIHEYPDHGILTYHQDRYLDLENNNLRCPVPNLLGKFNTYVYTKDTFDPAPRIFQECRYFGKKIIYLRDNPGKDGGHWYWKRGIKKQDISEIITAIDTIEGKISLTTELVTTHPVKQIGLLPPADTVEFTINKLTLIDRINNNKVWFCCIPWLMVFTDEMGDYGQCNFGLREGKKTLHNTSIKDWMTSDEMENIRKEMVDPDTDFKTVNKWCIKCINDEKRIKRSRRMIANKQYGQEVNESINWNIIMNSATKSMRGEPYQFKSLGRILEIQVKSFGIECNLDCHMCHHFSSSIRTKMAFEKGVWNSVVWGDKEHKRNMSNKAIAKKPVDEINNQIVELAPYIYNLKIIGGEPLIMKKHYELLDKLIEADEAKHIQIKYQTNATTTVAGKHRIFDYIPKFKSVIICVSLDGVGKYNDYIRRRSNYKTIKKNIERFDKYPNVQVDINSTVTFFSVLHLYEVQSFHHQPHSWWPVDNPSQMKANNLPQKIKDKLIPKYEKIPHMKEIADLLRLPPQPDFNAKELYKYCMDTDKSYKGTKWEMNLLDVFPELKEFYE